MSVEGKRSTAIAVGCCVLIASSVWILALHVSRNPQALTIPVQVTSSQHDDRCGLADQIQSPSARPEHVARVSSLDQFAVNFADIHHDTEKIATTNAVIAGHTRQIAESLDQLQASFQAATRSGGLIDQPESAAELYHNARTYESLGRLSEARASYLAMIATGIELVDAHQRFLQLRRLQEGPAGARAVYRSLAGNRQSPQRRLAESLLEDPPARNQLLESLLELEPDFAPAVFERIRCTSRAELGDQSLVDMAFEKNTLDRFFELLDRSPFLGYFLGPSFTSAMIADSRGMRRGPFSLPFDPDQALRVDAQRELGYRSPS